MKSSTKPIPSAELPALKQLVQLTKFMAAGRMVAAVAACLLAVSSHAASVSFQNSVIITDTSALDAPLLFPGATLVQAINFATGAQSVSTVGGQTINFTDPGIAFNADPGGTSTALFRAGAESNAGLFSGDTGNAAFNAILRGQGWAASGNSTLPETLRIGGLVSGSLYVVELLASDMRGGSANRTQQYHDTADYTGNASDSFSVQSPTYVLGAFTADASGYQDIFIKDTRASGWDTTFAGFTLYSATSVPEPTSAALLGLGGLAGLLIRRRQRD